MNQFLRIAVVVLMLGGQLLGASQPSFATIPVSFAITDVSAGVWEYKWTINYPGSANPNGYFGQLEVYLNDWMGTATNNTTTLNGATLIITKPLTPTGIVVTYPWNAAHFGSHPNWTQANIDLENPDQEGFDPDVGEIAFETIGADSAAAIYQFSYRLDRYLTSFFYEIHNSDESDKKLVQSGTAVVPLPSAAMLLGPGLLGLLGWKRFRQD